MKSIQNLAFTGGVVHVIDTFLMPPANFIQSVPQFNLTAAGGAVENAYVAPQSPDELSSSLEAMDALLLIQMSTRLTVLLQTMSTPTLILLSLFPTTRHSWRLVRPFNRCPCNSCDAS